MRSDAAFAEILYTFVLCFVVLNVATLSGQYLTNGGKAKQIYGLAIGFCIVVGGYAIGSVSGGSLKEVRSDAPTVEGCENPIPAADGVEYSAAWFDPKAAAAERDARFGVSSIRLVVLQLTSATSEVLAALQ